ncbi:hypothetical protein CVT25_009728 [Psilocybe cyanescens]|uniref:Uncharacterized protein n=1 Tax=Psilocybe cyanescens TaxID=93625 RepID=A0A409XGP1_PSICY|nr:hypothetical protein CVT25_009728 [Psilocybe cyanescens]
MSTSTIPSLSTPPTLPAVVGQTQTEDPTPTSGSRRSASTDIEWGGRRRDHGGLGREIVRGGYDAILNRGRGHDRGRGHGGGRGRRGSDTTPRAGATVLNVVGTTDSLDPGTSQPASTPTPRHGWRMSEIAPAFQSALFESPLSSQEHAHAQPTTSAPAPASETATSTPNLNELAEHVDVDVDVDVDVQGVVDSNPTATMSIASSQTPGPFTTRSTSSGVNQHKATVEIRNYQEKDRGTNKGKGKRNKQKGDRGRAPVVVSPSVEGLDSSIVIDPRRMHMTLGVMALSLGPPGNEDGGGGGGDNGNGNGREKWKGKGKGKESTPTGGRGGRGEQGGNVSNVRPASNTNPTSTPTPTPTPAVVHGCRTDNEDPMSKPMPALNEKTHLPNPNTNSNSDPESANPPHTKTVASALTLLSLLKPRISTILGGGKGVVVLLEVMGVLKTVRMPGPVPNITPHRTGAGFPGSVSEGRRSGVMSAGAGADGGGVDVKGGGGRVEAKQRQEKEKEREKESGRWRAIHRPVGCESAGDGGGGGEVHICGRRER